MLNVTLPTIEIPQQWRERLLGCGYNEADLQTAAQHLEAYKIKETPLFGEAIVAYLNQRHKLSLRFSKWFSDGIEAFDQKGRQHFILGNWMNFDRFFARGIVRRRSRNTRARYIFNGQASTGTVQVAYDGESDPITCPALTALDAAYQAASKRAEANRASKTT